MGGNYAKYTDQSIANDGHNIDQSLCNGFDSIGDERGQPGVMVDNLDYGEFHVKKQIICSLPSLYCQTSNIHFPLFPYSKIIILLDIMEREIYNIMAITRIIT